MASITDQPGGLRTIQFQAGDGKRKSLRLGKVSRRHAEGVKLRVEELAAAQRLGQPLMRGVIEWLNSIEPKLRDRVAAVGLVESRRTMTLGPHVDAWIASRSDVKDSTRQTYQRARLHLLGFFDPDRDLRSLTPGDADRWRQWLTGERGLAINTARKSASIVKQFMKAAVRDRLIDADPFADLAGTVGGNAERQYFITPQQAATVLDVCPDAEWRLLFALARYGGLRVHSETRRLRWCDIDWSRDRFTVHSPKTEHHEGKASRIVPIFPELRPHLLVAFDQAEPGAEWCIPRYRDEKQNTRTQLQRIIKRAGLEPWPKLWQNLRSTRETELMDRHPEHVVCEWIGNTQAVARQHYLQVTDDHYAAGAAGEAVQKAVHDSVQQVHAASRTLTHVIASPVSQGGVDAWLEEQLRSFPGSWEHDEEVEKWAVQDSNL